MTSPYLDRPLLPLAIALPRMLEQIAAELPTARPAEKRRLQRRAELIRHLLAAPRHGATSNEGATTGGARSPERNSSTPA